jgi:hypothetical protein
MKNERYCSDIGHSQKEIMAELDRILSERTPTNGRYIQARIEALQKCSYPEFYKPEELRMLEQPEKVQDTHVHDEQPEETAGRKLTAKEFVIGLSYFIARPIFLAVRNKNRNK